MKKKFTDFKNIHQGSKFLVLGCGESATLALTVKDVIVIGVNDIGRLLTPDYLLVVNTKAAFAEDRWVYAEKSRAKYVFSHLADLPIANKEKLVNFKLGRYRNITLGKDVLDYSNNSPYMACLLAYYMGASKIGLLGVDFTDNHFFAQTGKHPLSTRIKEIQTEYAKMQMALFEKNVPLVNLSTKSLLTLPKCEIGSF